MTTATAEPVVQSIRRRIGGQTVRTLGHVTPMFELDRLREFVACMSEEKQRPLRIIEVGSWVGESAIAMAQGLIHGGYVTCVDDWHGNSFDSLAATAAVVTPAQAYARFRENVGKLLGNTVLDYPGRSEFVAGKWNPANADLIFLDAEHTYEAVKSDIAAWTRHLAADGLLCGHDYCSAFPGLIQAVNEAYGEDNVRMLSGTSIWVAPAR